MTLDGHDGVAHYDFDDKVMRRPCRWTFSDWWRWRRGWKVVCWQRRHLWHFFGQFYIFRGDTIVIIIILIIVIIIVIIMVIVIIIVIIIVLQKLTGGGGIGGASLPSPAIVIRD